MFKIMLWDGTKQVCNENQNYGIGGKKGSIGLLGLLFFANIK